jgi:hypothetical protein
MLLPFGYCVATTVLRRIMAAVWPMFHETRCDLLHFLHGRLDGILDFPRETRDFPAESAKREGTFHRISLSIWACCFH